MPARAPARRSTAKSRGTRTAKAARSADHNICVSNGTLKLVVRRQDGSSCNGSYAKYTSARINSKRKREFNPWSGGAGVRVEAKIRMPAGVAGGWPAFWTLGNDIKQGPRMWNGSDDNDWPDSGEIDIAEAGWNWGGGSTSLNTLHYGTSSWSSYDGQFHAQANGGSTGIGRYEWHTFAVEWTPSTMTWYRDNQYTGAVNIGGLGGQDFEHDHFILLNIAMGGAGGGAANAADSYFPKNGTTYKWEQVMEIDYVRIDKLENSGGGGGGGGGGTIGNGNYEIKNVLSGKSMDVTGVGGGANTADGANVQVWTYGGGNNQKFTVTSLGGGQYSIRPVHSAKSIDVAGNSTADGANVHQWAYGGGNNQKFTIVDAGSGQYNIKPVHSGKCVEVAGNSTADGANVQQWGCVGSNSQKWTFTAR